MFHSKNLYSLFVFCIFVCLSSCDFNDLCDVTNDCEGKAAGTLIQDPLDCHNFYECVLDVQDEVVVSDVYITCPAGEYFDEENQQCTTETFQCSNRCSNLLCPKTCDGLPQSTRIAYPNDCNQYEVCYDDEENRTFGSCSEDFPYFNGTDCTTDIYSCCDICTPYCQFAYTQVEDPYDCYSFYLCEEDDYIPGDLAHFICPVDTHFDRTVGECVEGYDCTTVCGFYKK
ncbi:UNVERIFIED_CONTAM: hypothetical protein RMT77_010367 [Armadillidium vulgare]